LNTPLFDTSTLSCVVDAAGVALLTINRAERRNALDLVTMRAFVDAVARLAVADEVRALVVTGAGTHAFCSGGDLRDLSTRLTGEEGAAMTTLMGDALLALEALPYPVIAAINGYALGGGSELALACDLRVIDAAAELGFVHLRRGLIPGWGGGQRLLRLVGYSKALELLVRAQPLYAEELRALGMVSEVAPPGEALPAALALAQTAAKHDPAALRAAKALLQAGLHQPYGEALAAERALFPALWMGEAHLAATRAFIEKKS
jgi:enoyl-CoA hydratase/carnithine racemase